MTPNVGAVGHRSTDDHEIVAAIDEADGQRRLVIADLTCDGKWISMCEADAVSLETWR